MTARLDVERVAFERDRLALLVRVPEGSGACLGEKNARALAEVRPDLARHRCLNAEGASFGAILARTSLPHVLEHLLIDFQAEATALRSSSEASAAQAGGPKTADASRSRGAPVAAAPTFVGTTEWLDEAGGLARIEVNFTDDLIALGALKDALALLEGTVE